MKNIVVIAIALIVVGGASYTAISLRDRKIRELELEASAAEEARKEAETNKKKAADERKAAEAKKAAEEARAKAAADELEAQELAVTKARELARVQSEEARKAETLAKTAAENAKRAESERKAAEAKKAAAEALAEHAMVTNATRQAELQTALAAAHLVELDLQKILATSNLLALQKADYAAKLAEVEQLQEELRRREEETRPNKTLLQLMEQNEAAREAELAEMAKRDAQYAEEEAARRRILREGVPAAPQKPLSATDKRLAAARGGLDTVETEGRTAVERQIVARLEPLIRAAAKEGRMDDAEAYLAALKSLVPDYGK